MKRWPIPFEMIRDKRAYLALLGIIRSHMLRALGANESELHLPADEVLNIPDINLDRFIGLLVKNGVLRNYVDKKSDGKPLVFLDKHVMRVFCLMNSRKILDYMGSLPCYELSYDTEEDGVLNFWGARITIARSRGTNEHHLLALLISDKEKEWGCDEIWELTLGNGIDDYNRRKWRKLVRPCYVINQKVLDATQDENFLLITAATIRVNPRYVT